MYINVWGRKESGQRATTYAGMSDYDLENLQEFQEVVRRALDEVVSSKVVASRTGDVVVNLEINYAVGGGAKVVLGNDYPEKG